MRRKTTGNRGAAAKQLPPRQPRSGILRGRRAEPVQPHPRAQLVPVQPYQGAVVPFPQQQPAAQPVVQLRLLDEQTTTASAPARRARNTDAVSKAGKAIAKAAYRYRWQLAPVAAAGAVIAGGATEPALSAVSLAAVAVAGHVGATRLPETIAGRVWLSLRERSTLALGAAGAAAWSAGVAAGLWSVDAGGLGLLALATGYQAVSWWTSRKIRSAEDEPATGELSAAARRLIEVWPSLIAAETGPRPLRGSTIQADTMREPNPGTITFAVQLHGVHSKAAAVAEVRQELEYRLGIGVDTVALDIDRDDASRLLVTLATSRYLEQTTAEWNPVLYDNGDVDLAVTDAGDPVRVGLHNEAGVEHAAIVGTPGTGKSNTVATLVLPGVIARREVVLYIDGGQGTSASHLAYAADWWAVEDADEWGQVIETAHSVCMARRSRRRAQGLSHWRGAAEDDPVVTLVIDEATLVQPQLKKRHIEMVSEIIRIGRKLGVRVVQSTQDPLGSDWIGGRQARGMMAGTGSMIGHRPGDGTAAILTAGSTQAGGVDLRALPGTPGWCGVIRRGQVLATKCRVAYASPEAVAEKLAGFDLRGLEGEDLMAAGAEYRGRVRGPVAAAEMYGTPPPADAAAADQTDPFPHEIDEPVEEVDLTPSLGEAKSAEQRGREAMERLLSGSQMAAAATAAMNRNRVLDALASAEYGLTRTEISMRTGVSKTTCARALADLADTGRVVRSAEDGLWYPAADGKVA